MPFKAIIRQFKNEFGFKLDHHDLMSFIEEFIIEPPILKTEFGVIFIDKERFKEPLIDSWQKNFRRTIRSISNKNTRAEQKEHCYNLIFDRIRYIQIHKVKSKVEKQYNNDEAWVWLIEDHPQFKERERPAEAIGLTFDLFWLQLLSDHSVLMVLAMKFFDYDELQCKLYTTGIYEYLEPYVLLLDQYYDTLKNSEIVVSEYIEKVMEIYKSYNNKMLDYIEWVGKKIIDNALDTSEAQENLKVVTSEKEYCDRRHKELRKEYGFE